MGITITHLDLFIWGSEFRTYINSVPSKHRVFLSKCLNEILTSTQNPIKCFPIVKVFRPVWVKQKMVILIFLADALNKKAFSTWLAEKALDAVSNIRVLTLLSTTTVTPAFLKMSELPTPDLSSICGVPRAPAVMTTSLFALIVLWTGFERASSGWWSAFGLYSMPMARGGVDSSKRTRMTFESVRMWRFGWLPSCKSGWM